MVWFKDRHTNQRNRTNSINKPNLSQWLDIQQSNPMREIQDFSINRARATVYPQGKKKNKTLIPVSHHIQKLIQDEL